MQLHLECSTGISGDMFLAALSDLGLDLAPFQDIVNKVGVGVDIQVRAETKCGLLGALIEVIPRGNQHFRNLDAILGLIEEADLTTGTKGKCTRAFTRLAEVEASVHGVELSQVHFHEVGAVDTIVDVLGCFWGLEQLGVTRVTCSWLPWFQGFVNTEHGRLPLPAPATVRLLQGKPVYPSDFEQEIITPTGALLLDQITSSFQNGPRGGLERTGLGWGSMDLETVPNGLRVFLVQKESDSLQDVWILESNLDHLSGEDLGSLFSALQAAGALDFIYLPGVMKKNRPGGLLQVLSLQENLSSVQDAFFQHSLTLGLRRRVSERVVLPRESATLPTALGSLRAKALHFKDRTLVKPEFEALQELSEKTGRSVVELRYLLGGSQETQNTE